MDDLPNHPAFQSGIAPFVVALGVLAATFKTRWTGLCVGAGLLVAVALLGGFALEPLTVSRRLILLVLAASLLGAAHDALRAPTPRVSRIAAVVVGLAAAWMLFTVLRQADLAKAALSGGAAALFLTCTTLFANAARSDSLRAGGMGLALGVGAAGAAIFGASLYFGALGIALAAISGGYLLAQFIAGRRIACGATFVLPVGALGGGIGLAAVFTGQLPWYALTMVALLPAIAVVPLPRFESVRHQLMAMTVVALLAGAVVILAVWKMTLDGSAH